MSPKTFLLAKTFHANSANFLRQEKSLRDHGGALGCSMRSGVTRAR
jgi:hypothetical protein